MFSKILIKLVDQAIVPAVLLISVRIISVIILAKYFGLYIALDASGFIISRAPSLTVTFPADYIMINSYSTLAIIIVLGIVLLYILAKSFIFHDSHITPGLTARVFSLKLSAFIQNSFELYSQGTVWLSYMYLIVVVSGVLALFGLIYSWIFVVSLILSVVASVLFILDVENELNVQKTPNEQKVWYHEEEIIKFAD
jgi:hypothetical protein